MKHNFLKKLTALLLGAIMVFSMIPAMAIGANAAETETLSIVATEGVLSDKVITWTSSNFKFENAQDKSTNAIRIIDTNHFRIYANSKATVTALNGYMLSKIIFTATSSSYATVLSNSATTAGSGTVSVSGSIVTIVFDEAVESISFSMTAQARINNIEVELVEAGACTHTYSDECIDTTCDLCGEERLAPGHKRDNCEDTVCTVCGGELEAGEHEYSNECDASCNNCSVTREITPPAADSALTLDVANELGLAMGDNTYTTNYYYVTGTVKSVGSATYGNITIEDKDGNTLYLYTVTDNSGNLYGNVTVNKPEVGDIATFYGPIGSYNSTAQMNPAVIYVDASSCEHTYANEYDAFCDNCGEERELEVTIPAADTMISILIANKLGVVQGHNTYTEGKYYVTGTVKEITSEDYGNMVIVDENGNELVIYGSYNANGEVAFGDMENPFKAGDEVTVYGVVGQYNGTAQIKNGWVTVLPKFEGFGITLNKGITIRVKLTFTAEWIAANPDATIMFSDAQGTQLTPEAGTKYYSITLTPGEIGRTIKLSAGNINENVSFSAYKEKIAAITDPTQLGYTDEVQLEALKTLLDAIYTYGQVAANAETAGAVDFDVVDDITYEDEFGLFGGNLTVDAVLGDYANVGIAVNATENLSYTIVFDGNLIASGDDFASLVEDGKFTVENLRPANYSDLIELTVINESAQRATVTFSFNSYLKALYKAENGYVNIAAATYAYGLAVQAYQQAVIIP